MPFSSSSPRCPRHTFAVVVVALPRHPDTAAFLRLTLYMQAEARGEKKGGTRRLSIIGEEARGSRYQRIEERRKERVECVIIEEEKRGSKHNVDTFPFNPFLF